jgi:8-amino-7-oxononanoate synthase
VDLYRNLSKFRLARLAMASGHYPYFIAFDGSEGTETTYKDHRLIMAGSNNYLGLSSDPRVKESAHQAIERYGTSCTGSRFVNGNLALHEQLEHEIADFIGKEAALVFSTGYQVNIGVISSLVGMDDVVVVDRHDHASLLDGCDMSRGTIRRFRHNCMDQLERILSQCPDDAGRLVVVDGVYSMGGDLADLPSIVALCNRYEARLLVDDAHGIGVMGAGRGTAAYLGVEDSVDLITGTFSKSLASLGGFVAGTEEAIHYIKHFAKSLIFSAGIPPANAAAALTALRIVRQEPDRVERVREIGRHMKLELQALGLDTGETETPIIPIYIEDTDVTQKMWRGLFDAGVYVNFVMPLAIQGNHACLRTSYMATHSDRQLEKILETFETVGRANGVI